MIWTLTIKGWSIRHVDNSSTCTGIICWLWIRLPTACHNIWIHLAYSFVSRPERCRGHKKPWHYGLKTISNVQRLGLCFSIWFTLPQVPSWSLITYLPPKPTCPLPSSCFPKVYYSDSIFSILVWNHPEEETSEWEIQCHVEEAPLQGVALLS